MFQWHGHTARRWTTDSWLRMPAPRAGHKVCLKCRRDVLRKSDRHQYCQRCRGAGGYAC